MAVYVSLLPPPGPEVVVLETCMLDRTRSVLSSIHRCKEMYWQTRAVIAEGKGGGVPMT